MDAVEDRPGRVEVHVGPVVRLGRCGVDRITSTVRETADPRHTPGYEREVVETELKRNVAMCSERVFNYMWLH